NRPELHYENGKLRSVIAKVPAHPIVRNERRRQISPTRNRGSYHKKEEYKRRPPVKERELNKKKNPAVPRFEELPQEESEPPPQQAKIKRRGPKEMIETPKGWGLMEECLPGRGEHRDCRLLQLEALIGNCGGAYLKIAPRSNSHHYRTLLQIFVVEWTFRSFHGSAQSEKERVDAARDLMIRALEKPDEALLAWEEALPILKPLSKEACDWPLATLKRLMELRKSHCQLALRNLTLEPNKAINVVKEEEWARASTKEGQSAAGLLAQRLARVLTEMKAEELYGKEVKVMHTPTLIIGDKLGVDFGTRMMKVFASGPHSPQQLATLVPNKIYVGNEVNSVVVLMGRDYIKEVNGPPEEVKKSLRELVRSLMGLVKKIVIVAPPLVQTKRIEFERVYSMMDEVCKESSGVEFLKPGFSKYEGCPLLTTSAGELTEAGTEHLKEELIKKGVEIEKREKKAFCPKKREVPQEDNNKPGTSGSGRTRGAPRVFVNRGSFLAFLVIWALATTIGVSATPPEIDTYWCRFGESQLWDLSKKVSCLDIKAPEIKTAPLAINIYEKIESPLVFGAYWCEIRRDITTYYSNWLGDIFPKHETEWSELEGEECLLMGRKKKCPFGVMIDSGAGGYMTKNALEIKKPGFFEKVLNTELQANVSNCYVHNATILVGRETWEVTIPGGVRKGTCFLRNGSCPLINAMVTWEEMLPVDRCKYGLIKSNWAGEVELENRIWSTPTQDFVLSWKAPKRIIDCGIRALVVSDQGLAITEVQYTQLMEIGTRNRRELISGAIMAGADTAGSFGAIRALNRTLSAIAKENCLQKSRRMAELTRKFAKNPEGAAFILLNRTVQARWAAEGLLQTWECVPIPMGEIKFRKSKLTDGCFQFAPVNTTILGRPFTGFLDPVTLVLSDTSPKGPCEKFQIHYFRIPLQEGKGGWKVFSVDQTTGEAPTNVPKIIEWKSEGGMKLPVLQATVFHQVLSSPLSNFIPADHGEEINRRLMEKEVKVEEKLKENDQDQIGFPNFGLGEMEKKFKESMNHGTGCCLFDHQNSPGHVAMATGDENNTKKQAVNTRERRRRRAKPTKQKTP
uniref:Uncharacterized protein n=1 Tax=Meloidogyne javanica TaxID=6303 RepID=A0A915MC77_MELJA